MKGIKREFSVARTPQHNGFAKRKNRTLIEAARTMLADSLLPIPFWAETVNIARYVQNRVLVTKPHNKIPYELLLGRTSSIGFMRPFGCPVTILNILDPLGKFDGKADKGFLVGYFISSKAFRVFNSRTRIVQETLHINFLENQPNVAGSGLTWLFDIDTLTQSMNYQPVGINLILVQVSKNILMQNTDVDATFEVKEPESAVHVSLSSSAKTKKHDDKTKRVAKGKSLVDKPITVVEPNSTNSTNTFSVAGPSNSVVSLTLRLDRQSLYVDPSQYPDDPDMSALEDITYSDDEEDVGAEADISNLETNITDEGIDYEEVFIPVARIEAIRLFLAYASFMGFMVYQMDLKSAFLYETIKEVYVCQPPGFEDPDYPDKVYVDDIIFGSTNKDLCKAFEKLMKDKFQMSSMRELTFFLGLQVKQKQDGIFISQDKYGAEILRKFGLVDGKSASTPIDTEKPLLKDPDVKRIFRYLKGKPHLGLWYPKDSPFNLVAYSDSDYDGASLDRKSTTGGCQFLGCRLISWQCKKETGVATSFTEAEYVAAASCCAQVLWIQN
nr:putative ribonuclease H-like domain-containing protein [Tanacetum cinerariifolium]